MLLGGVQFLMSEVTLYCLCPIPQSSTLHAPARVTPPLCPHLSSICNIQDVEVVHHAKRRDASDDAESFTEMCSGSEAGSYSRLIDCVYHLTLGLRVIKKKKKKTTECG